MAGRWPFTAEKIAARLDLIEPLVHRRRQVLAPFRMLTLPEAVTDPQICDSADGWQEIPHDSYWGGADLNFLLKTDVSVPDGWNPDRLALHLPLGVMGDIFNHPEALVRLDRKPIGSADRYHHTLPLPPSAADGNAHALTLQGWTGLTAWPPDPASKARLFMGQPALVERDPDLLSFVQLARAAWDATRVLDPDSPEHRWLLAALDNAFRILDTRAPLEDAFRASVPAAHADLTRGIDAAGAPLTQVLHGIGHAHMDIAYLWPISQIRLKNARTYSNVLRLMEADPDFRFSHSQPQLYAYMARDYPEDFARIRARVAEGRWEVMGGMWVEPDLNIPGPEALVRQLALGRQYFKQTFGDVETPVLWLPDTFGFPAQIPQLMRHAGLKWFATNKLNWNQKNRVPWSTHHWAGLDGSRVLAHILTTPRDVQYLPFPTNYKSDLSAAEVLGTVTNPTVPDSVGHLPICFGYGDGGGGPTEDLLARARAFAAMPGLPRLRMGTVRDAFEALEQVAQDLPVWTGEHYMEGHRGVLTSQGWIKRANRFAERALHEAEALSAMAGLTPDLTEAWQLLCLNQFHDIVTGTSVPEVFEDARADFARIMQQADTAARAAARDLSGDTHCVANTSPLACARVVRLDGLDLAGGQIVDGGTLALFDPLPPYSVTPVTRAATPEIPVTARMEDGAAVLENALLRVAIGPDGQLLSVHDKQSGREALKHRHRGNVLQAFEDRPICWDAWDIDPSFEDRMDVVAGDTTLDVVETGPLRASVRVTIRWRASTITQTIRLTAPSGRIDFETDVEWHQRHTLLKAAFPTCVKAPMAEFDVQWGVVERSTARESSFDAARFEVPAQKWARLTDGTYAVAVLNDCKYGYDVRDDTIRITLIKSSTSPDPNADQGHHRFTYSLLAGADPDRQRLNREAYALNTPVRLVAPGAAAPPRAGAFVRSHAPGVVIETVAPAQASGAIILRVFESLGQATDTVLETAGRICSAEIVRFDETHVSGLNPAGHGVPVTLKPFEILTLRITLGQGAAPEGSGGISE